MNWLIDAFIHSSVIRYPSETGPRGCGSTNSYNQRDRKWRCVTMKYSRKTHYTLHILHPKRHSLLSGGYAGWMNGSLTSHHSFGWKILKLPGSVSLYYMEWVEMTCMQKIHYFLLATTTSMIWNCGRHDDVLLHKIDRRAGIQWASVTYIFVNEPSLFTCVA